VPAANAFFLEVARRDLDAAQLARLHEVIETELSQPNPEPLDQLAVSTRLGSRFVLGLEATSIDDLIDAATPRCLTGAGVAVADAVAKIREREAISPTALGRGVAVPHAIIAGAPTAIALVTCARPLSQNGPDGLPIETAFVLICGQPGRPHLEILAQIAELANRGLAAELRSVTTVRQARRIVERIEVS
jgi:PTS system nitrogen regulatory IIA component